MILLAVCFQLLC